MNCCGQEAELSGTSERLGHLTLFWQSGLNCSIVASQSVPHLFSGHSTIFNWLCYSWHRRITACDKEGETKRVSCCSVSAAVSRKKGSSPEIMSDAPKWGTANCIMWCWMTIYAQSNYQGPALTLQFYYNGMGRQGWELGMEWKGCWYVGIQSGQLMCSDANKQKWTDGTYSVNTICKMLPIDIIKLSTC